MSKEFFKSITYIKTQSDWMTVRQVEIGADQAYQTSIKIIKWLYEHKYLKRKLSTRHKQVYKPTDKFTSTSVEDLMAEYFEV